jgi:hypothetical protein
MAQIPRQGSTRMPPVPWSTRHPVARGVVGGGGNERTTTSSGRRTLRVGSSSSHHIALAAQMPGGDGTGPHTPEPAATHWERATNARSDHRHVAPTAEHRAHLVATAPHSSMADRHTRGGRGSRGRLPHRLLKLCRWSAPTTVATRVWPPPESPYRATRGLFLFAVRRTP